MAKSPAPTIIRSMRPEKPRPSAWTKNGVVVFPPEMAGKTERELEKTGYSPVFKTENLNRWHKASTKEQK